jgi:hypothetical protein
MKHLKLFEELHNLSKDRKWPTNLGNPTDKSSDKYFTYNLKKEDIGKYLNTWFVGQVSGTSDVVYIDEMITLKKVDEETANSLYNRYINPVSINILAAHRKIKHILDENKRLRLKGKRLLEEDNSIQNMKAQIHSIDDSSFGIWWMEKSLEELKEIRIELMNWISKENILNGEEFLDYCISLGADIDTKDYN